MTKINHVQVPTPHLDHALSSVHAQNDTKKKMSRV